MELWCNVSRGNNIESRHEVYATVINGTGKIIFSTGMPNYVTCIRSSLKPFQASAAILSGATESAGFTDKEIALMCASHNGEKIHVQTAKEMAEKLDMDASFYECGSHAPYDIDARKNAKQKGYTVYHNNCSGKHSGMLAIAKKLGVKPNGYIKHNHPVQRTIFSQIKKLTRRENIPVSIDGCSAPTPFFSILEIAKLFQLLGTNTHPELIKTFNVMTKHPYLIAGNNRFDTDFNTALQGRGITKVGGEAIRGAVIKTKKHGVVGIAQKIIDGNQRANETAIMKILNYLDLLLPAEKTKLQEYEEKKLFNHRKILIGNIRATIQ